MTRSHYSAFGAPEIDLIIRIAYILLCYAGIISGKVKTIAVKMVFFYTFTNMDF